jgi:hypothetical protein
VWSGEWAVVLKELNISINTLHIADVDTGSVVAVGNNYFCDWRTYAKANSGFGRLNGDKSAIVDLVTGVEDPDLFDMINIESPQLEPRDDVENCLDGDREEE